MPLATLALLLQQPPAQNPPPPPQREPTAPKPAPLPPPPQWTTNFSTYWIEPPHESGYLSAIVNADRGPLHLEAHWAYEARDTYSLFVGRAFPIEGDLSGTFTPRFGMAGGDAQGFVPAAALELEWKKLSFFTDVEYMIGTTSDTSDFLYAWSELDWALTDRFTFGLVGQRTNQFNQEYSVDHGLLFGVHTGRTRLTAYVFNLDGDDPYLTVAFEAGF